jgi:cytidylyltransferase-like protein
MNNNFYHVVNLINQSPYKTFLTITGGGTSFIGEFCKYGGASKTIVGHYTPYSKELFDEFIGQTPEHYVSEDSALKLAVASYNKCLKVTGDKEHSIGIGATSSIATNNEREGRIHNFYIAGHKFDQTILFRLTLNQGRLREQEEEMVNQLILNTLNYLSINSFFTNTKFHLEDIKEGLRFYCAPIYQHPDLVKLFNDGKEYYSNVDVENTKPLIIYPGSFNKIHTGHLDIAHQTKQILGQYPIFEISILNTDKPQLDYLSVQNRINDIKESCYKYLVNKVPLFYDKVEFYKKLSNKPITFIMGLDVWLRIWDAKYSNQFTLEELFDHFIENNVKFLVFDRSTEISVSYAGLDLTKLLYDGKIQPMNNDCSSTELRKKFNDTVR